MAQIPREFKDFAFPKSTISRLIKEAQGPNPVSQQKISQFAINVLSGLFTVMLSNQAINLTQSKKKKTVTDDAVIDGLESLGFPELGVIVKQKLKELQEVVPLVQVEEKKEEELDEEELIELDEEHSPTKEVRAIEQERNESVIKHVTEQ